MSNPIRQCLPDTDVTRVFKTVASASSAPHHSAMEKEALGTAPLAELEGNE